MNTDVRGAARRWAAVCIVGAALFGGCDRTPPAPAQGRRAPERLGRFSMEELSGRFSVGVSGESAEVSQDRRSNTVKEPVLSLKTENETIEITTGSGGEADIRLDPKTRRIASVVLEGGVRAVQKDRSSGAVLMDASCRTMTYRGDDRVLVMEGDPVVRRQGGVFSGTRILYHLDANRLEIKGNVNVGIPVEKTGAGRP